MKPTPLVLAALLGLCSSFSACGSSAPTRVATDAGPATLGIHHFAAPAPGIFTAGQPNEAQFDALGKAGVKHVINLRPASEGGTGWEEQHAATAGVQFVRLPIAGADGLSRDNVDAFAKALEATGGEPTLVSCGSSNRVGALFALKAYWRDGKSKEEALAIGKAAGMTKLGAKVEELLAQPR